MSARIGAFRPSKRRTQMKSQSFRLRRLQDPELSDKLLTTLTILLSLLVFVVAPLQANGVIAGRYFGLIFGAVLIPAAFMLAANLIAAGSIVCAIILIVIASNMEVRQSTVA